MFHKSNLRKTSGAQVRRYEKDDEEKAFMLMTLGLSENASKMLVYISRFNEAETYDFECAFRLSQPEVSKSMKELKKHGWIKESPEYPKDSRIKKYKLEVVFNDIIAQLEEHHKKVFYDMNTKLQHLFHKNEYEGIVEYLVLLGLGKNVAKIVTYLKDVKEAISSEIIENTGLYNPEISIVVNELILIKYDWINVREQKRDTGRPKKVYSLKVGFDDIIEILKEKQKKDFDDTMDVIDRLRN